MLRCQGVITRATKKHSPIVTTWLYKSWAYGSQVSGQTAGENVRAAPELQVCVTLQLYVGLQQQAAE